MAKSKLSFLSKNDGDSERDWKEILGDNYHLRPHGQMPAYLGIYEMIYLPQYDELRAVTAETQEEVVQVQLTSEIIVSMTSSSILPTRCTWDVCMYECMRIRIVTTSYFAFPFPGTHPYMHTYIHTYTIFIHYIHTLILHPFFLDTVMSCLLREGPSCPSIVPGKVSLQSMAIAPSSMYEDMYTWSLYTYTYTSAATYLIPF
jgi:hypothetical protein